MGTNGDHLTVISDSGCTGAIIDQSVSAQDALPVTRKGGEERTSVGGGGEIFTQPALFLMPYQDNSEYEYQEVAAVETKTIVSTPAKIDLTHQMNKLFEEYSEECAAMRKSPNFSRDDCPSQYGGQTINILMGNKEIIPVLEYQSSSGLCVYSHPYKVPPNVPRLAVGGSIPTTDSMMISLVMECNMKPPHPNAEDPENEDDDRPPALTDSETSETEDEKDNAAKENDSDCSLETSNKTNHMFPCG